MQNRTGNAITLRVLNGFRCELEEHPQMMSSSSLHRRATPLCLDPEILHMVKIRLVLYISGQIKVSVDYTSMIEDLRAMHVSVI